MSFDSRLTLDAKYAELLGRALYAFAYLEHVVVWLTECTEPGFARASGKLTARDIGKRTVAAFPHEPEADLAQRFFDITPRRDALMHGRPFSANDGAQRLSYNGRHGHQQWLAEDVALLASDCEILAVEVLALLQDGRLDTNATYTDAQNRMAAAYPPKVCPTCGAVHDAA